MRGVGYSVFEGEKPQKFNVKIIGIWPHFGSKFIVAKVSGGPQQIIERALVISGMSGSPVYVKGKKIGAVSRTFRNQKEAICLITPIEDMLEAGKDKVSSPAAKNFKTSDEIAPITVPVSSYGFNQRSLELIKSFSKERGLNFEFVKGRASGGEIINSSKSDPSLISLEAGDAIAVELMGGDFGLYGVGTVAHVDENKVYAFGHSMNEKGEDVDMPFYKARILTVVAAALSFKITEGIIGPCLGSIKKDMFPAIIGIRGAKPEILPVSITLKDGEYEKDFNVRLPKKFFATDILALMAITNAITLEKANIPEATIKLGMKVTIKDVPFMSFDPESGTMTMKQGPLTIEDSTLTTTDKRGLGNSAITDFYMLLCCNLNPFLESPVRVDFEKIEFTIEILEKKVFEAKNGLLKINGKNLQEKWSGKQNLHLIEQSVKPGDVLELNLLIEETYAGKQYLSKLHFPIPQITPDGRINILVVNGKWLSWLLSIPEYSMGKDVRAVKDLRTLILSVESNNKPSPDRFYALVFFPVATIGAAIKTMEAEQKEEIEKVRTTWKLVTKEELRKDFFNSRLMIIDISSKLGGETKGLLQFVIKVESQ